MNAREFIVEWEARCNDLPREATDNEHALILRALRLLAAAEANDGTAPIVADVDRDRDYLMLRAVAIGLERERNGLAARVAELEQFQLERQSAEYLDAERYRYLRDRADENSDGPIICSGLGDNFDFLRGSECDEEIDAARSKP